MKKKCSRFLLQLFALIGFSSSVNSQTVDQSHTGTNNWYTCITSGQVVGQSFKAGASGSLQAITIDLAINPCSNSSAFSMQVEILDGSGFSGAVLSSNSITMPIPCARNMFQVSFPTPANLISNQMYTIKISAGSNPFCETMPFPMNICANWYTSTTNSYADGSPYVNGSISGTEDLYFTTIVGSCMSIGTDVITASNSYTWINGVTYTSSNYTEKDTLTNVAGCDSIVTLNLTMCNINNQTVNAPLPISHCGNGSSNISMTGSEIGTNYYLRKDADNSIIEGPIAGTGNAINFNTGNLTSTTSFHVYAEKTQSLITSLSFDGIDDYVSAPSNVSATLTKYTIEGWLKWSSGGTDVDFVCGKEIEVMEIHTGGVSNNNIRFIPVPGIFVDAGINAIPTNSWVHIACVYDPTTLLAKIYINGMDMSVTISGTSPLSTPVPNGSSNFLFGKRQDSSFPYNGNMEEMRIWNTARTQTEIQSNMNTTLTGGETGLVLYYKFNEASGTSTLTDASPNAYIGSLFNMNNSTARETDIPFQIANCTMNIGLSQTVTINQSGSSSFSTSACGSYLWIENNMTYNISGTYTDTLTNISGCDSIITLNLTINQPSASSTSASSCSNYIWNGTTYTASGTYTWTGVNSLGCDSIATLNLNINQPSTSSASAFSCDNYTWNGTTYNTSGTYTWTGVNALGCDSIVALNLTIDTVINAQITNNGDGTLSASVGTNYQWLDCGNGNLTIAGATSQSFTPTIDGSFSVIIFNGTCYDTSNCISYLTTGIRNYETKNIHMYPNPTTGSITIASDENIESISVYNQLGELVMQLSVKSTSNMVDLNNLQQGIYTLQITLSSQKIQKKIVLQY